MDDIFYLVKNFKGQEHEVLELRSRLFGSLLLFTQVFFYLLNDKLFKLSNPSSAESHFITICRDLTAVFRGEILCELINVAPGSGKSELCKHYVAWAQAQYPDSHHMYVSYSAEIASTHTYGIKRIMSLPLYKRLFGVDISRDSSAKDYFTTTAGGSIGAYGSMGSITGRSAGQPNCDRYSGALILDDMHKPNEVYSDTIRESVIKNYMNTIKSRRRGPNVPIIFIGQRLHEEDIGNLFISGMDGNEWHQCVIPSEDEHHNPRYPEVYSSEYLEKERKFNEEVYWAQHMQNPLPAGGAIFKKEYWHMVDQEPKLITTFITADTAETDKNYNDPTVFCYWGLHYIVQPGGITDILGLYLIDMVEIWVEPKDLAGEFFDFYGACRRHTPEMSTVAIEKKSTGVTLASTLSSIQGIRVLNVERTAASGSKTSRFLSIQPIIASKRVSLPRFGRHTAPFINQMGKITKNNSHKHDDMADNLYDACKIGLIDKTLMAFVQQEKSAPSIIDSQMAHLNRMKMLRNNQWQR